MFVITVAACALASPPAELDYQGFVSANSAPVNGECYLKFAITDENGTTNYWSNDGALNGEPTGFVTGQVCRGRFTVTLGAPPMAALDPAVFGADGPTYLRTWFTQDRQAFHEVTPKLKFLSTPYSLNTLLLAGRPAEFYRNADNLTQGTLDPARCPNAVLTDGSRAMSGALVLHGDPSQDREAATKQYVDARLALELSVIPPCGNLSMGSYTNRP